MPESIFLIETDGSLGSWERMAAFYCNLYSRAIISENAVDFIDMGHNFALLLCFPLKLLLGDADHVLESDVSRWNFRQS